MPHTALLFPGQGSQFVGMVRNVYDALPEARAVVDRADDILGVDLSRLMFEGPEASLTRTDNAQPAIFVASVALLRCAQEALPDVSFVAGHSVGEFSALVAAGSLGFEEGLRLVRRRGELMQGADSATPGGMLAVLGLDDEAIEEACASVAPLVVCAANYNAPGQTIVSGELAGLDAVTPVLKARGARRVLPLNVSAAFHSPIMRQAAGQLRQALAEASLAAPRWPVIGNVSAQGLTAPDDLREELAVQIAAPVRWHRSISWALQRDVTHFVEIGPGSVLTGLMKRIAPAASAASISQLEDIQGLRVLAG
ncbi:MAG: ACP S-malonyltransferase [Chloroflexota bacterium]